MKMHVSLKVSDLGRSIEFYRAFFGVPPHKVRPDYANFDLAQPPLKFALTQNSVQNGAGALDHLGFQVLEPSALELIKNRLRAAGLATFDESDTTCCYAKQDKIWVHDPDGNEWEIYYLTDDLPDDSGHDHAGRLLTESSGSLSRVQPAHRCGETPQSA